MLSQRTNRLRCKILLGVNFGDLKTGAALKRGYNSQARAGSEWLATQVNHVMKVERMHDADYLVVTVFAAGADSQDKIDLGRSNHLQPTRSIN